MNSLTKKITIAFRELRKKGYIAKQNWQCCQSCGTAALPDDCKKYVFYHRQDREQMQRDNQCYLAWGGNGAEIVSILESAGIDVSWNGSNETRIKVG